jgi:prepilin-type N-terminal cleavage/methylation domain-containing protein
VRRIGKGNSEKIGGQLAVDKGIDPNINGVMNKLQEGWTLIELLIVMALLSGLMAILLPAYSVLSGRHDRMMSRTAMLRAELQMRERRDLTGSWSAAYGGRSVLGWPADRSMLEPQGVHFADGWLRAGWAAYWVLDTDGDGWVTGPAMDGLAPTDRPARLAATLVWYVVDGEGGLWLASWQ